MMIPRKKGIKLSIGYLILLGSFGSLMTKSRRTDSWPMTDWLLDFSWFFGSLIPNSTGVSRGLCVWILWTFPQFKWIEPVGIHIDHVCWIYPCVSSTPKPSPMHYYSLWPKTILTIVLDIQGIYIYIYIHMYIYRYIYICINTCQYIYVHVYICIYIYVSVFIYVDTIYI